MIQTFKFGIYATVRHLKSQKEFIIVGLPDKCRIEHNWQPAYLYLEANGMKIARSQTEMEDGRFELVAEATQNKEQIIFHICTFCKLEIFNANKVLCEEMKKHIETCSEHPLFKANKRIKELEDMLTKHP